MKNESIYQLASTKKDKYSKWVIQKKTGTKEPRDMTIALKQKSSINSYMNSVNLF